VPHEFDAAPYLVKPVGETELVSTLDRLIGHRSTAPKLGNLILDTLAREAQEELTGWLERVNLRPGDILDLPGQPVTYVHFPIDCLISLFATNAAQRRIETVSIGRDGMTAPAVLLGNCAASGETVVQCAGVAWRIRADALQRAADQNPGLRHHMLNQVDEMLRQVMDTTWYTGHGTIVSRLARWVLQASDRLASDAVSITHERLADILGVRRSGVTVALHELEGRMLIRASRSRIVIRDRAGLTAAATCCRDMKPER
jgi:CRP-like cAMP-binding protein